MELKKNMGFFALLLQVSLLWLLYSSSVFAELEYSREGALDPGHVDTFSGDLSIPISLVNLSPRQNDLVFDYSISYSSNVQSNASTWNQDASTDVLGLGWSAPVNKIVRDLNDTGNTEDDVYQLVSTELGSTPLVRAGGTDSEKIYQAEKYQFWDIRYLVESESWRITDASGRVYQFGGKTDTEDSGNQGSVGNSIEWAVKWHNWIGSSNIVSDGQRLVQQQIPIAWHLSSVRNTWGESISYHYRLDNDGVQRVGEENGASYSRALYLDQVVFNAPEGEEGYNRDAYVQFNYCDKQNVEYKDNHVEQAEPDAYQERYETLFLNNIHVSSGLGTMEIIDFHYGEQSPDDAYDNCEAKNTNTVFLGEGDLSKRVLKEIRYLTTDGLESSPPHNFSYWGENSADGVSASLNEANPVFAYPSGFNTQSGGALLGAMRSMTSPGGAQYHYTYSENELPGSPQNILIDSHKNFPSSIRRYDWQNPRPYFLQDAVLVLWRAVDSNNNNFVLARLYQWSGGWKIQNIFSDEPAAESLLMVENFDQVDVQWSNSVVSILYGSPSSLNKNDSKAEIFYRSDTSPQRWYTQAVNINEVLTTYPPDQRFISPDTRQALGDNFIAFYRGDKRLVAVYSLEKSVTPMASYFAHDSTWQNTYSLLMPTINSGERYFLAARHNYFVTGASYVDVEASQKPLSNKLQVNFLNEEKNWLSGDVYVDTMPTADTSLFLSIGSVGNVDSIPGDNYVAIQVKGNSSSKQNLHFIYDWQEDFSIRAEPHGSHGISGHLLGLRYYSSYDNSNYAYFSTDNQSLVVVAGAITNRGPLNGVQTDFEKRGARFNGLGWDKRTFSNDTTVNNFIGVDMLSSTKNGQAKMYEYDPNLQNWRMPFTYQDGNPSWGEKAWRSLVYIERTLSFIASEIPVLGEALLVADVTVSRLDAVLDKFIQNEGAAGTAQNNFFNQPEDSYYRAVSGDWLDLGSLYTIDSMPSYPRGRCDGVKRSQKTYAHAPFIPQQSTDKFVSYVKQTETWAHDSNKPCHKKSESTYNYVRILKNGGFYARPLYFGREKNTYLRTENDWWPLNGGDSFATIETSCSSSSSIVPESPSCLKLFRYYNNQISGNIKEHSVSRIQVDDGFSNTYIHYDYSQAIYQASYDELSETALFHNVRTYYSGESEVKSADNGYLEESFFNGDNSFHELLSDESLKICSIDSDKKESCNVYPQIAGYDILLGERYQAQVFNSEGAELSSTKNKYAIIWSNQAAGLEPGVRYLRVFETEEVQDGLVTKQEFDYHALNGQVNQVQTSVKNSTGILEQYTSNFTYPQDLSGTDWITAMVEDHLLDSVLMSEEWYEDLSSDSSPRLLSKTVSTWNKSWPLSVPDQGNSESESCAGNSVQGWGLKSTYSANSIDPGDFDWDSQSPVTADNWVKQVEVNSVTAYGAVANTSSHFILPDDSMSQGSVSVHSLSSDGCNNEKKISSKKNLDSLTSVQDTKPDFAYELRHSILYDDLSRFPIASFSNAVVGEDAGYIGFESYEKQNRDQRFTIIGEIDEGLSHSGLNILQPRGSLCSVMPVSFTPRILGSDDRFSEYYVASAWVKVGAGASCQIEFLNRSETIVEADTDKSGWQYIETIIPYPKQDELPKVTCRLGQGSRSFYSGIDDFRYGPLDSEFSASVYHSKKLLPQASLGDNGEVYRNIYNLKNELVSTTGPTESQITLSESFNAHEKGKVFNSLNPNSVIQLNARTNAAYYAYDSDVGWAGEGSSRVTDRQVPKTVPYSYSNTASANVAARFSVGRYSGTFFNLSLGNHINVRYENQQYSLSVAGQTVSTEESIPSPVGSWLLFVLSGKAYFFADGVFQLSQTIPAAKVEAEPGIVIDFNGSRTFAEKVFIIENPVVSLSYLDALYRPIQLQELGFENSKGDFFIASQTLYNGWGQQALQTKRVKYDSVNSLDYLPELIKYDWQNNQSSDDDLSAYYANKNNSDGSYAFSRSLFENNPLSRLLEVGEPGEDYTLGTDASVKYSYGFNQSLQAEYAGWSEGTEYLPDLSPGNAFSAHGQQRWNDQLYQFYDQRSRGVVSRRGKVDVENKQRTSSTVFLPSDVSSGWSYQVNQPNYHDLQGQSVDEQMAYQSVSDTDMLERLVQVTDPDRGVIEYAYDGANNLRVMQDAEGKKNNYSLYYRYDSLGRVIQSGVLTDLTLDDIESTEINDPYWPSSMDQSVVVSNRYTYDLAQVGEDEYSSHNFKGRVSRILSDTWAVKDSQGNTYDDNVPWVDDYYFYDVGGQVIRSKQLRSSEERNYTFEWHYQYDQLGNITQKVFPSDNKNIQGLTVEYDYNNLNQLSQIKQVGDEDDLFCFHYFYRIDGLIANRTAEDSCGAASDHRRKYGYDFLGRPIKIKDEYREDKSQNKGSVIYQQTMSIGSSGPHPYYKSINTSFSNSDDGIQASLHYDQVGQLKKVNDTQYAYDHNGNIVSSDNTSQEIFPGTNQISSFGEYSYSFNDVGKLTSINKHGDEGESKSLTYSPWQQPKSVEFGDISTRFYYGSQRAVKIIQAGGSSKEVIYGYELNGRVGYELYGVPGSFTRLNYIYGPDGLLTIVDRLDEASEENYYPVTDYLGSVQGVRQGDNSELSVKFSYSPWGVTSLDHDDNYLSRKIRYRYTAQEWDEETGFYNYHLRFYDPFSGRFNSPDPVASVTSPYSYTNNNPVNFTDPSGAVSRARRAARATNASSRRSARLAAARNAEREAASQVTSRPSSSVAEAESVTATTAETHSASGYLPSATAQRPDDWKKPAKFKLTRKRGRWSGQKGNSTFWPDDPGSIGLVEGEGIPFVSGYPDLAKWSSEVLEVEGLTGYHSKDMPKIYKVYKEKYGLSSQKAARQRLSELCLVGHHCPFNLNKVPLVPGKLHGFKGRHKGIKHMGGAYRMRNGMPGLSSLIYHH